MQIPIEVLLGPGGAIVALVLWILDLRKERDDYKARLVRIIDKVEASLDKPA